MYKGESNMDSGYGTLDGHCRRRHMTVSDVNGNKPTPCMNRMSGAIQRVVDKMEEKFNQMQKNDSLGLFAKMLLCIVCCARIFLGDDDEDVQRLKSYVSDKTLRDGCDKEILANPDKLMLS